MGKPESASVDKLCATPLGGARVSGPRYDEPCFQPAALGCGRKLPVDPGVAAFHRVVEVN